MSLKVTQVLIFNVVIIIVDSLDVRIRVHARSRAEAGGTTGSGEGAIRRRERGTEEAGVNHPR